MDTKDLSTLKFEGLSSPQIVYVPSIKKCKTFTVKFKHCTRELSSLLINTCFFKRLFFNLNFLLGYSIPKKRGNYLSLAEDEDCKFSDLKLFKNYYNKGKGENSFDEWFLRKRKREN